MSIPKEFEINDIRINKDFALTSFSGYLKNDVMKALMGSITEYKIEETCNWCIELMLSQQTDKLYDKYILYACKYIHINNPKLPEKLYNRYKLYIDAKISNIDSINSQVIRNHLIELSILLCMSNKVKPKALPKIKQEEFNSELLVNRFKSNDKNLINHSIKYNDPEEIKIILNELWFSVNTKKMEDVLYWLSWIITYEKILNKKKQQLICASRKINEIPKQYYTNVVWLIWEIILNEANYKLNSESKKQVSCLYNIYIKNYKKTKTIYLIINAIRYFIDTYNLDKVINSTSVIIQATSKVNILFQQKKVYEITEKSKIEFVSKKIKGKEKQDDKYEKKKSIIEDIDNLILNA